MKTPGTSPPIQHLLTFENWILAGALLGMLLLSPVMSHAQGGYPNQDPHGDMSDPMRPPPGIIGVALHLTAKRVGDPAGLFIRATHPMGPAVKAGLMHGQEILAVDGQSIKGKTYREVVAMIRGEIGKSVTLQVKTFSDVRAVRIIRVSEQMLAEEKQI